MGGGPFLLFSGFSMVSHAHMPFSKAYHTLTGWPLFLHSKLVKHVKMARLGGLVRDVSFESLRSKAKHCECNGFQNIFRRKNKKQRSLAMNSVIASLSLVGKGVSAPGVMQSLWRGHPCGRRRHSRIALPQETERILTLGQALDNRIHIDKWLFRQG